MSYVGAVVHYDTDKVGVWERNSEGKRIYKEFKRPHYFYVPKEGGAHRGLDGVELEKLVFDSEDEFKAEGRRYPVKYESDIPPLFKVLMNEYHDLPTPVVNYAFLDIETDYSSKIGFPAPSNPYARINAVTIWQSWTKQYLTYVLPPILDDGTVWQGTLEDIEAEFKVLAEKGELRENDKPIIKICKHENELIACMLEDIQDADIISGWNSEFYDIPYIVRRVELQMPHLLKKLCFTGCAKPKQRFVERFGTQEMVYSLSGRTHLDYLDLFKKFTFEGRTSYSLGNILQEEIGLPKLHYEGTLEQLYKNDFPRFVAYNFRDVGGLVDLDIKFKFIQLVNQMAHENTCLFENILGTVRYVETGIANRAHNVHNLIVPDKRMMTDGEKVEGALVLNPRIGMHEWIGSVDINSLYPSVIRSLNISPEKFVGQFMDGEADWRGIMIERDNRPHYLRFDDGEVFEATGEEWRSLLVEKKWAVSAYGTVFDQSNGLGLVADTLAFWFAERKRLQAEKKKFTKLAKEEKDPVKKAEYERQAEHYDLLQLTKKIQLNSTYGALLNAAFRFGRKEMGASVTACGRMITTHMMEKIHSLLEPDFAMKLQKHTEVDDEGKPVHVYVAEGKTIIYGDTDSCYFKTHAANKEEAIAVADETAKLTNDSFPEFMRQSFNCQPTYDELIKAGREVVAIRGVFQAKKKYILRVIDLEGMAVDKLKSQGSEIKKADTPKIIQQFLKDLMGLLLDGQAYPAIEEFVNRRRKDLLGKDGDIFSMGVSKQVNNLDAFYAAWTRAGKPAKGKLSINGNPQNVPGHVRAAMNYNSLVQQHEEGAKLIKSGDKVIIFYLKPNADGMKSIALPADAYEFPQWFDEHFVVDKKLTEQKMIDNKLDGIFEAMGWEVPTPQRALVNKLLKF